MIAFRNRASVQKRAERFRVADPPVGRGHLDAVGPEPLQVLHSLAFGHATGEPSAAAKNRMLAAKLDQPTRELDQLGVRVHPIDPRNRIVLAIRIVVAALGTSELVAGENHRYPLRQYQRREEVAFLPIANRANRRIVGWTFDAAIPRAVVVISIAIPFLVRLVVFLVV